MTVAERKANELAELISAHRVVRVSMQSEHAVCVAREDLPEYNIRQGEMFDLFASSYAGYAYIVNSDGCGCFSYEYKHGTCKHSIAASQFTADRYFASKSTQKWDESDTTAHVEDTLSEVLVFMDRDGEFGKVFLQDGSEQVMWIRNIEEQYPMHRVVGFDEYEHEKMRAQYYAMSEDERRVVYSNEFDLSYGDYAA